MIEIICVGDELLDGRTRDLNAHWLGQQLGTRGLVLRRVTFVADTSSEIESALSASSQRARYIIVSGGLGPTPDDLTRNSAARWLGVPLVENEPLLDELKRRFADRGIPFSDTNRPQASFPKGALILPTEVGSAAGFRLEAGETKVDFYPGVPREFRWFVERYGLPLVDDSSGVEVSIERRWRFYGIGESNLCTMLGDIESMGPSIHYNARFPEVHIFATSKAANEAEAVEPIDALDAHIRERVGKHLIGVGEASLSERVGEALAARGWRLTAAESCTGGQIGHAITSAPGSSAYFDESFVTYSNDAKIQRLGVQAETLERFGAVSAETASEMAEGARQRAHADIAVAVTGIAGPTGGTADKPVGTVDVALATPDGVFHKRLSLLKRTREMVRTWTTWAALTAVLWYLQGRLPSDWKRVD